MKWLETLQTIIAGFLGASITLLVADATGHTILSNDAMIVAWSAIATVSGAWIAVQGAVRAARHQVELQREHSQADKEEAMRQRHRAMVLFWLVPYIELRHFAWTPLTDESGPFLFMRSRQHLTFIRSLMASPISLQPGDLGLIIWPYSVSALQRLIDQLVAGTNVKDFAEQQFITGKAQEAAEDACHALHSLLISCWGHAAMGDKPEEMIPTMDKPSSDETFPRPLSPKISA